MIKKPKLFATTQLYVEPDINFSSIGGQKKLFEWSRTIDNVLNAKGILKEKYSNYHLILTITTKKDQDFLDVRKPSVSKKNQYISYTLWIPYNPVISALNPLEKLSEYFKQGLAEVLLKLEYQQKDIEKVLKVINSEQI